MNVSHPRAQLNEQILEEACEWFIEYNEAELDAAARESFNQWLRRSPEHVRAYLEIASTWENSSGLTGPHHVDVTSLVAAAMAESNIVALNPQAPGRDTDHTPPSVASGKRPWRLFATTAAIGVAASTLFAIGTTLMSQHNTYTTATGEQRSIVLADGSTVELDTHSRLRVRFSHAERLVELIDGQALFQVKKAAARPFTVLSNGARVRAVGTQFDVYRKEITTTVTVVEGRVAITLMPSTTTASDADPPLLLSAGEQSIVTPNLKPRAVHTDVAVAIAWTQRKLIFDETPLSEAVAEFNRYNSRQIIIEDPSLAGYHIRGNFEAGDPNRLLQFLRDRFDADVREQGHEIRISRK